VTKAIGIMHKQAKKKRCIPKFNSKTHQNGCHQARTHFFCLLVDPNETSLSDPHFAKKSIIQPCKDCRKNLEHYHQAHVIVSHKQCDGFDSATQQACCLLGFRCLESCKSRRSSKEKDFAKF
jgi:hypothetical protein